MGATFSRLLFSSRTFLVSFLYTIGNAAARSLETQVGAGAFGAIIAQWITGILSSSSNYIQDLYTYLFFTMYIVRREDALSIQRYVKQITEETGRFSNVVDVHKDYEALLKNDATDSDGVIHLENNYEFKPSFDKGEVVRINIDDNIIWISTPDSEQKNGQQRRMRRYAHEFDDAFGGGSGYGRGGGPGRGSHRDNDSRTSAVASHNGAISIRTMAREQYIQKAEVYITLLNVPWYQSSITGRKLIAKMLSKGRELERQDDERYTTYEIGLDTNACDQLERWLRAQNKTDKPSRIIVVDGDGIGKETDKSTTDESSDDLAKMDIDLPTYLMRSADEKELRLSFRGKAMWVSADRGIGYIIRIAGTDNGLIEQVLIEGYKLLESDIPDYTTFRFGIGSLEVKYLARWVKDMMQKEANSMVQDLRVKRKMDNKTKILQQHGIDSHTPDYQFVPSHEKTMKFKFQGRPIYVDATGRLHEDDSMAYMGQGKRQRHRNRRRRPGNHHRGGPGGGGMDDMQALMELGYGGPGGGGRSGTYIVKIPGKAKETQLLMKNILLIGHELHKGDNTTATQIFVAEIMTSGNNGAPSAFGGGGETPFGRPSDNAKSGRRRRTMTSGTAKWNELDEEYPRPLDTIILPGTLAEDILNDALLFLAEKRQYNILGIPWRRTYMFEGVPGTGKTSLVKALAGALKCPLYSLEINVEGMTANHMRALIKDTDTPSVILVEEIDGLLDEATAKNDMRVEDLMQILDGVVSVSGKLIFLTTNFKERISEGRIIRGGRVDVIKHFTYATKDQVRRMFLKFEKSWKLDNNDGEKFSKEFSELVPNDKTTLSNVQSYLQKYRKNLQAAVENLRQDKNDEQARWKNFASPTEQKEWAAYHEKNKQAESEALNAVTEQEKKSFNVEANKKKDFTPENNNDGLGNKNNNDDAGKKLSIGEEFKAINSVDVIKPMSRWDKNMSRWNQSARPSLERNNTSIRRSISYDPNYAFQLEPSTSRDDSFDSNSDDLWTFQN